jgi:hypothetical protein
MNELEGEKDLQAHLERRSRLHRTLSEIDRLEPPEELDRVVLSRARVAIQDSEGMPLHRTLRSSLPFGLVATLVLVITLVIATHPRSSSRPTADIASAVAAKAGPSSMQQPAAPAPPPAALRTTLGELGTTKQAAETGRVMTTHAASAGLQAPTARDATAWLKDIRDLRRAGRNAEAEHEWSAFLKAHPEYDRGGHCVPGDIC